MVLREIVEDRGGDVDRVRPLELERVRGRLHHARGVPRVEHLAEGPLQVEGLRRRAHHRMLDAADDRLDRAQQAGRDPRALQQRAGEEGGGGLAVGAGDAGDAQRGRRIAVEAGGGGGHRRADVLHDDFGHAEPQRPLDDERHRPSRHRVRREVVPVAGEPRDGEEQGPWSDEPIVESQARDDHVGAVPEQFAERHASGSLRARPAAAPRVSFHERSWRCPRRRRTRGRPARPRRGSRARPSRGR